MGQCDYVWAAGGKASTHDSDADGCWTLQLPDDVKQSIEDAGARYIP